MTALDRLLIGCILIAVLLVGGFFGIKHYGEAQYEAGQAAAIATGEKVRQAESDANLKRESDLREKLTAADAQAKQKEREHAVSLEAAKRRMRTGADSLRCPTSPVSTSTPSADRPVAGGLEVEPAGPTLMPESASDLLGVAADIAGLLRKYERLEQRFDACAEMSNR